MRDTIGRSRSADTGGLRGLLLIALVALLHAALIAGTCHIPASAADRCPVRVDAPAASGATVGHCASAGPEPTSNRGDKKHHPGSGARRLGEGSGCQLRHQAPTGTCGKAFGDSSLHTALVASGAAALDAVNASAAAASPAHTVVLRC